MMTHTSHYFRYKIKVFIFYRLNYYYCLYQQLLMQLQPRISNSTKENSDFFSFGSFLNIVVESDTSIMFHVKVKDKH